MKSFFTALLFLISLFSLAQENTDDWFEFKPIDYFKPGSLNMSHWLDKPAGKHGFLQIKGKDFVFEDGTPIKFWGVNIASGNPFSPPSKAEEWTRFMTKYGINGVRFHKFTWDATDGIHSTQLTDAKWKNFDYFCKTLRDAGIYYSWSHIYGHRVMKADSVSLLAYEEVKNTKFPWSHLNGTTSSLVNFADDLQALNIALTVNMLEHINPFTGLRYADDPALSFVELQNEDDIFWAAIEQTLKQTPTYRKLLCQKFSAWLTNKYQTQEALLLAWNHQGFSEDESLSKQNIYPHPNHGLFSYEYEQALKENRNVPVYIADRATFLYEEQLTFYKKFIAAIRNTGYKGVIVGSCWQAGSGITHFYNLHTDYVAGAVDRHNYFGGGTGHRLVPGKFDNRAMVSTPGSGLLSTGFQQVIDRPFQISEWMSLIPTEWTTESAPLIAAYGMGLQGWDASYAFAMDFSHFTNTIQNGYGVYNVTSPTQLALYPALAAMVYRGDVKEAEVIANRNVYIADLKKGKLNFLEKTAQQYDVKSFESSVPLEALAIGKVTVSFDGLEKPIEQNLDRYWNKEKKIITSVTGQLKWSYDGEGYATINTNGTKGLIGFTNGETLTLGNLEIQTNNKFAIILITSLEKDKTIDQAKHILVTTMARARNTGMEFNDDKSQLLKVGTDPILLEPVACTIKFRKRKNAIVHVLDHTGSRTSENLSMRKSEIMFEGKKSKAIYYEIEFP